VSPRLRSFVTWSWRFRRILRNIAHRGNCCCLGNIPEDIAIRLIAVVKASDMLVGKD
jgi:hypothetical protein